MRISSIAFGIVSISLLVGGCTVPVQEGATSNSGALKAAQAAAQNAVAAAQKAAAEASRAARAAEAAAAEAKAAGDKADRVFRKSIRK